MICGHEGCCVYIPIRKHYSSQWLHFWVEQWVCKHPVGIICCICTLWLLRYTILRASAKCYKGNFKYWCRNQTAEPAHYIRGCKLALGELHEASRWDNIGCGKDARIFHGQELTWGLWTVQLWLVRYLELNLRHSNYCGINTVAREKKNLLFMSRTCCSKKTVLEGTPRVSSKREHRTGVHCVTVTGIVHHVSQIEYLFLSLLGLVTQWLRVQ